MKYSLLLFFILTLLLGCTKKDESEWTILVYMAADNGLNNAAVADINEMEKAIFSDDINVIVQIDNNEANPNSGAYRYKISHDQSDAVTSNVIDALGEIDSGDYATLRDFIDWGYSRYPARNQALVIWSHGSGWYNFYNQFCPDYQSQSAIDIPAGDLRSAFSGLSGKEILILDACYMQTVEVLAEIGNSFQYVIGSEDLMCEDGFPYDDILNQWEEQTQINELCISINTLLFESYLPGGSQNDSNYYVPISCSAFRTAYLTELMNSMEEFQLQWSASASQQYFLDARESCFQFNDLESDVDIKQFFTNLLQRDLPDDLYEKCIDILAILDNAFVSQEFIDYPANNIGTAVIWYPDEQFNFESLHETYELLNFAETGWDIFLQNTFIEN